jgi:long-chain acyl-CoA synthetase
MFTSDSLGDPKGVLRTAENVISATDAVVKALQVDTESRILTAVPLFHAYGWDIGLLPTLNTGATMYLEEEISSRRVAKLLRDHTIDILPGTPTMYGELSKLPTAKPLKVENPRFISGGSILAPEVTSAILEKYGVRILSCYHTTETGVVALDLTTKAPNTVGKTLDAVDVKIAKPSGVKLTGSKTGCIWVRSEALSPRSIGPYKDVNARKKSKNVAIGEIDKDGWYRTGDLGKMDRSSRLILSGREDDVVKIEGKRVALNEVEGCLEAFPKVKEAQARLVRDPFNGAMVVAKVVATSKCHAEEIIDHCARNLAPYKVPRRIEFCEAIKI